MSVNIHKHISGQFNEDLERVRNHVLTMGGIVERQLENALLAVQTHDEILAKQVLQDDYHVNAMEVSIDEECTRIIIKRQPAASDLRLILAISKTIADLERIGDEIGRIAKVALTAIKQSQRGLLTNIHHMGNQVLQMLRNVLDAFARMDADAAYLVHKEDIKIDQEYEAILRQLMTYMMQDPRSIPQIMDVTWSIRSLERMGDRCQNIAEYIIYLVKGKDIRHTKREDIEKDFL